jgi:hypothetical protein
MNFSFLQKDFQTIDRIVSSCIRVNFKPLKSKIYLKEAKKSPRPLMPHHRVPVGPSCPHQPIMSPSSSSLSLSLSLFHPCPHCHCHLCTPHPPCEQLLTVAERGAGSSWCVGAISVSSVPIASSSHSMRAGAHSSSGGCCPVRGVRGRWNLQPTEDIGEEDNGLGGNPSHPVSLL